MVEVLIVTVMMLLFTDDETEADPSPELSCVNFVWSCNSRPLNLRDVMSPSLVLTAP